MLCYDPVRCMMDYMGKISQSGVGFTARSQKGMAVNPFPEGVALFNAALSLAKYFSCGGKAKEFNTITRNMVPVRD